MCESFVSIISCLLRHHSWSRKSLAECVTTRGETGCSPAAGTPSPAVYLAEAVPALAATLLLDPAFVVNLDLVLLSVLSMPSIPSIVMASRRVRTRGVAVRGLPQKSYNGVTGRGE